MKLLLVEDNETDAALILLHAKVITNGYEFIRVRTIKEATEHLGCVDVIICDLHLPDSLPQDTVDTLGKWSKIWPVVVMSHNDDEKTVQRCMESGVKSFLSKRNITAIEIQSAVQDAIHSTCTVAINRQVKELSALRAEKQKN